MKRITNILLSFILTVSLAGCATGMLGGKSGTKFKTSVTDVYDASLNTLNEENLPVIRKSISRDMAKITSEYPNGTPIHIIIRGFSPQYTEANIRVGSVGDDYRAYDLMKKIESRLK